MHDKKDSTTRSAPHQEQRLGNKATQTKGRKRKVLLYSATTALTLAGAGVLASLVRNPTPAILLLWIGLLVAAFALRLDLINNGSTHRKANIAWLFTAIPSTFLCGILLWMLLPEKLSPAPEPNFQWSLEVEGFPDTKLFLTNEAFLKWSWKKMGDLPDGRESFIMVSPAVIVVPVQDGESNKIFHFNAENHSTNDLKEARLIFGAPKEWRLGIGSNWESMDIGLILYDKTAAISKLTLTNLQYFSASRNLSFGAFDNVIFSITNIGSLQVFQKSAKGPIQLAVRATDQNSKKFEQVLFANMFFVPASVHVFKPALMFCKASDESGIILPTDEEIKESQMK